MGLSCSCDSEPEPGDIVWCSPDDYETLNTSRRQRCRSCGELIDVGATVIRIGRYKCPETDIECRIYGDDGEIPIADHFLCEECADLFFSLSELGFCFHYSDNMRELVREYAEMQRAML